MPSFGWSYVVRHHDDDALHSLGVHVHDRVHYDVDDHHHGYVHGHLLPKIFSFWVS